MAWGLGSFSQFQIALVALGRDFAGIAGGFDRAVGFVNVAAISKATGGEMRMKVSKEQGDVFGRDVVEVKLAHAGHVADKPAFVERDQFGVGRCVRALSCGFADGACTQVQSGLQIVEQTRFSDARRPHEEGGAPAKQVEKCVFARPGNNARIDHRIPHRLVGLHDPMRPCFIGEIEFVQAHGRGDALPFGNAQHAVEQVPVGIGFPRGNDGDNLIDIGGQELFFLRPARCAPRDFVAPRAHLADHTRVVLAIIENHAVSHSHRIDDAHPPDRLHALAARPRRGLGIFELFSQATGQGAHDHAVRGLDGIVSEVMADDSAFVGSNHR